VLCGLSVGERAEIVPIPRLHYHIHPKKPQPAGFGWRFRFTGPGWYGMVWYGMVFLSEIRTRTKALKGKKGVGPEQNLRAPGGRGGGKEGAD